MHVKEIFLGPRDEFAAKTWIRDFDQGFDSLGDTLAVEFCNAVFGDDSIHICSRVTTPAPAASSGTIREVSPPRAVEGIAMIERPSKERRVARMKST
jgi:hypothetical protein